jgi:NADPH-dependent 2,4-dienoyl-CoA reductase/sulfur reductase-like enzyme
MDRRHFLELPVVAAAASLVTADERLQPSPSARRPRERRADVAIVGAGFGGCAAALAAARHGLSVLLTEETDWIGGQLTSQAVPLDENAWIETAAAAGYRALRDRIRGYYARN